MSEVGRSLPESVIEPSPIKHKGRCTNCGYLLELYEIDFKKRIKVMRCQRCGMLHYYKKDIIGKWRIQRAQKF